MSRCYPCFDSPQYQQLDPVLMPGGSIQVTVLNGSKRIEKLMVTADDKSPSTVPMTIEDFEALCGPIAFKRNDKLQGVIYERPGVRIATDFHGDPPQIRWLELF